VAAPVAAVVVLNVSSVLKLLNVLKFPNDLNILNDGGPPTNEPPVGDVVELECDSDDNQPICGSGTGGPGDWLCRTIVDPDTQVSESFSTCGNAASALPEDACGCCGGECPVQCTCACALEGALEGVEDGVLVSYYFPSGVVDDDRCLTPLRAISLIANPADRFSCAVCP
jgi:hypothetical protein